MTATITEPASGVADLKQARRRKASAPDTLRTDRLPPHDATAEQGVLGCILLSPIECLDHCLEKFKAEVFYDLRHQTIYDAMVDLRTDNEPVDIITLQGRLKQSGALEQVGGIPFLNSLMDAVPSAANVSFYADIVLEAFGRRQMLRACTEVIAQVYEPEGSFEDFVDGAERDVMRVRGLLEKSDQMPVNTLVKEALTRIEEYHQNQGRLPGLSTGFTRLDRLTTGLRKGEMIVVAGRPSTGKSAVGMQIAENAAVDLGQPVGVFSLEMTAASLVERMLSSRAGVNLRKVINDGILTHGEIARLTSVAVGLGKAPLWIDDTGGLSILQLRAKARRMHRQHGIKLFIVDYLQLLHSTRKTVNSRVEEIGDISNGLKAMAKELDVPVLVLAQLNRESEKEGRTPRMSDLREGGQIEQDADVIALLYRPKSENEKDEDITQPLAGEPEFSTVNLLIAKQRNGPAGVEVPMSFKCGITRFYEQESVPETD